MPQHAAVSEAVSQTPRRSKGFVNALLRSFCRGGKKIPLPERDGDPHRALSVLYSVPVATAKAFCEIFGVERAESVLAAFAKHPPVAVRVNTERLTREEFLARVPGATPTRHAPFGAVLGEGTALQPLLAEGLCFVQDEASQIAVAALDAAPDMRVLDLCAAPGSKSFGAALTMQNKGEVKSFDLHENKISLIQKGATTLGLSIISADAADARDADPAVLGFFDRVICDVPCSGFGVLAKKPDIRYKNIEEAKGLLPVQAAILRAAARCVTDGGLLLYSTCTLLPAENEAQVTAFLAKHEDFVAEPFSVGGISADTGMLTLLPDEHGTDGFFIARLRKKG